MLQSSRRHTLKQLLGLLALPAVYQSTWADTSTLPKPLSTNHVTFLTRDDAKYLTHRQIFNKRITLMPRFIAVCLDTQGVQEAIRYANQAKLQVTVKSGGHSFEGFSLNEGGLLIDLSLMKAMRYQTTTKTLVIQPGAKLGKVYEYLAQYKRLIPAGSCAGVGVAGLVLGGGYGFFAREYGLTCDSLQRVQLVDGQGNLHDSNTNPELLWACRGGNNGNFGIVTELTFNTHPAPELFNSYRFKYRNLTLEQATQLAKRWFNLMKDLPNTSYSSWVLNNNHLTILLTDFAKTPASTLQTIVKELSKNASEATPVRKDAFLTGIKRFKGGVDPMYFKNVSAGYYQGFNDIEAAFPDIFKTMTTSPLKQCILQINTMGGAINKAGKAETAAYPHRAYNFLGEFQVYYNAAKDTPKAETIVNTVQKRLTAVGIKAHYRNYPDISLPNWQQAYYGASYPRLQQLKKQLDPNNRIYHPQSVKV
ncbi:MAG: FAD-binding oxidoreductase [Thiofilum sp.]|uniref:FAD-binding oxidoreductase n=1 Tax=Thiofilum sp. TaxID=2212733 RepID=UPI0025CC21FB|nr:FAD-binding oxidoreductase [Thiofilum sp.]MBK8454674.1 FAD-binding oxidoreductase [Thiofilum sp.]